MTKATSPRDLSFDETITISVAAVLVGYGISKSAEDFTASSLSIFAGTLLLIGVIWRTYQNTKTKPPAAQADNNPAP